jgi:hypothetical protein
MPRPLDKSELIDDEEASAEREVPRALLTKCWLDAPDGIAVEANGEDQTRGTLVQTPWVTREQGHWLGYHQNAAMLGESNVCRRARSRTLVVKYPTENQQMP